MRFRLNLLRTALVFAILFSVFDINNNTFGATFTSRTSSVWSSRGSWLKTRTGTISVTSGSKNVSGTSTLFSTELVVGDTLKLRQMY